MITVGLMARIEAKPRKEEAVELFLKNALPLVLQEPDTMTLYATKLGPATFGIFDTLPHEAGRQQHLAGKVAAALMANAAYLWANR
jgi:hypothetical protein